VQLAITHSPVGRKDGTFKGIGYQHDSCHRQKGGRPSALGQKGRELPQRTVADSPTGANPASRKGESRYASSRVRKVAETIRVSRLGRASRRSSLLVTQCSGIMPSGKKSSKLVQICSAPPRWLPSMKKAARWGTPNLRQANAIGLSSRREAQKPQIGNVSYGSSTPREAKRGTETNDLARAARCIRRSLLGTILHPDMKKLEAIGPN